MANDYYTKEAIDKRVNGVPGYDGVRRDHRQYHRADDYVEEIMAAADVAAETNDRRFLQGIVSTLIFRLYEQRYTAGIESAKKNIRKKLGL